MDSVSVSVPARLHLGFLDLNGSLGRKFGSLGIALSEPLTRLSLRHAAASSADGPESGRAAHHLERLSGKLGQRGPFALRISEAIPAHAGLGSGTQIALAVSAALRSLSGMRLDARADAAYLDRGARSGIGVGIFDKGGVVLDAGRSDAGAPPPVVAQFAFPEEWRILLVLDSRSEGVHGPAEAAAFAALPPFPENEAAHLCRLVLMQALPALMERDLPAFGAAIAEMQRRLGAYFAPAQGGRYASRRVGACMALLEAAGAHGSGQSSWGPTGFAFAPSEDEARCLHQSALRQGGLDGLEIRIVQGNNQGARIAPQPVEA